MNELSVSNVKHTLQRCKMMVVARQTVIQSSASVSEGSGLSGINISKVWSSAATPMSASLDVNGLISMRMRVSIYTSVGSR